MGRGRVEEREKEVVGGEIEKEGGGRRKRERRREREKEGVGGERERKKEGQEKERRKGRRKRKKGRGGEREKVGRRSELIACATSWEAEQSGSEWHSRRDPYPCETRLFHSWAPSAGQGRTWGHIEPTGCSSAVLLLGEREREREREREVYKIIHCSSRFIPKRVCVCVCVCVCV